MVLLRKQKTRYEHFTAMKLFESFQAMPFMQFSFHSLRLHGEIRLEPSELNHCEAVEAGWNNFQTDAQFILFREINSLGNLQPENRCNLFL